MVQDSTSEYIPTERVAIAVFWLMQGNRLTTAEIARLTGLTPSGAWYMLQKICRVLPVSLSDSGEWEYRGDN
jgi:hypothetical protein